METGPIVIALHHATGERKDQETLREGQRKLTGIFEETRNIQLQRRVYIEEFGLDGGNFRTARRLNPHHHAAREAERRGWVPVCLDTKRHDGLYRFYGTSKGDFLHDAEKARFIELNNRFVNCNLRERMWAKRFRNEFGANDYVVLHPSHVAGFLQETGISPERVIWIHRPFGYEIKRLDPKELAEFNRLRNKYRKTRRGRKR